VSRPRATQLNLSPLSTDTYTRYPWLAGRERRGRMGLLDTYRINKAIAVLLTSQDAASAETMQAVATLKRLGESAIPKLIEALGKVRTLHTVVASLTTLVQNTTLPLFGDGLASANPRVVAGVVEVLTQATAYDPNRLRA
jgi:hypothetical protein